MQLLKQTRANPGQPSRVRAWELFYLVSSTMPPSKVRHWRLHSFWRHARVMRACGFMGGAECTASSSGVVHKATLKGVRHRQTHSLPGCQRVE